MKLGSWDVTVQRKYLLLILLLVFGLIVGHSYWSGRRICASVSDAERDKLSSYFAKRLGATGSTALEVSIGGPLAGSCVRKLFVSVGSRPPQLMYLSENHRLLFRQIEDVDKAPTTPSPTPSLPVDMSDLLKSSAPSLGDHSAPVSIVEFSDFQCPYCKRLATTLHDQVLPKEGKRVRIIFRQFPLEFHHNARPEAELSQCVAMQSNAEFWSLHDFLFSHQTDKWRDDAMAFVKTRKNLNMQALNRCLDQKASATSVDQDLQLGQKYGVSATPTLFINGVRISGARDAESVEQIIESAASAKRSED